MQHQTLLGERTEMEIGDEHTGRTIVLGNLSDESDEETDSDYSDSIREHWLIIADQMKNRKMTRMQRVCRVQKPETFEGDKIQF